MLRLKENFSNGFFCNSNTLVEFKNRNVKSYSRYTYSGRYIIMINDDLESTNKNQLIIFDSIRNTITQKYLKKKIISIRNINFIDYYDNQKSDFDSNVFDTSDIILIEDSKGSIEVFCVSNNKTLLKNCYLLCNKFIKKAFGINVSQGILILIILTNKEIYIFSNFKYESFDYVLNTKEYKELNLTDVFQEENKVFDYYKIIIPEFNNELSSCCINTLGRLYFTCCNEIFKLQLPNDKIEKASDFQIEQVYIINDKFNSQDYSSNFHVTDLNCYETFINHELFELIYIIFEDIYSSHNKKLSLLKIKLNDNLKEYEYNIISNFNNPNNCTHILSHKILNNGQLGVIWESNNQIYINIFGYFLNNNQEETLGHGDHLNKDLKGNFDNCENFRDLTSLLYGDSPLIYINKSEFTSNKKTDEILKIHGRVFSESLKLRDIEKEELYIKNMIDSIKLDDNTLNLHIEKKNSIKKKCKKFQESKNNKNPLRNMEPFIFSNFPVQYSPIIGTEINDNITNLPDDWYSNMSYTINAFTEDLLQNIYFIEITYTCWFEGIFNYLINNLSSIIKTPQIHLPILKKLLLLPPNTKYSKPTSLWSALNSIDNLENLQNMEKNDLELLYNIIDLYIKNGMFKIIINFTKSNNNFSKVLYLWSIYQYQKTINCFEEITNKIEISESNIFELKNNNILLELLLKFSLFDKDQKLLSLFISGNITVLKSIMFILEFLIQNFGNLQKNNNFKFEIITLYKFTRSFLDWWSFYETFCSFISKLMSDYSDNIDELTRVNNILFSIAINNINELNMLKQTLTEENIRNKELEWQTLITISFLLESFTSIKFDGESNFELNQLPIIQNRKLVLEINKFLIDSFSNLSNSHTFAKLTLFPQDWFNFCI